MTTEEIIEGESTEVPERALVAAPATAVQSSLIQGGTAGLALMSEEEFERNLAALKVLRARVDKVKLALMTEGVDYGVIPGTKKPALLKPGAETLLRTFGLADSYVIDRHIGDGEDTPDYEIIAHARIHIGDTAGPIVAEGIGTANTFETKHRYRGGAGKVCPNCGKTNVIHSKPPRTGWWCGTRDGGCSANFEEDDARITSQPDQKAENPDPWDLANTVTKMAKKRALVDGILTATGTSGVFTQDEDAPGHPTGSGTPQGASGGAQGASGTAQVGSGGPAGLQGVVEKSPDGIRKIKLARDAGNEHYKLEVVMKVDRSRHTIMLLDDASHRGEVLGLQEGDVIRAIGGAVELIQWQEGKPKKKEVWGCTDVAVLRDGAWITGAESAPSMPLEDPENRRSGPEAVADPTPTPTAPSGTPGTPETTHSDARSREDEIATLKVKLLEPIRFHTDNLGRYAGILKLAELATAEIINAVLGDDPKGEVEAQLGGPEAPGYLPGAELVIVGTWKSGWVILTAVGAAK